MNRFLCGVDGEKTGAYVEEVVLGGVRDRPVKRL